MAAEKTVSPMLAKLGGKLVAAHMATKDAPPDLGGQLPGGIQDGTAELKTLSFGVYEKGDGLKGEQFFMGMGVALTPKTHNGRKVAGLQTRVGPIPMCDTKRKVNSVETVIPFTDHYREFTDVLKGLGLDVAKIVPPAKNPGESQAAYDKRSGEFIEKSIVTGMKQLEKGKKGADGKDEKIVFSFRTWQGSMQVVKPNGKGQFVVCNEDGTRPMPGVFATEELAKKTYPYAGKESQVRHYWQGACDRPADVVTGGGVEDDTPVPVDAPEADATVVDDTVPTPDDGDPMDTPSDDLATVGPNELDQLVEQSSDPDDAIGSVATERLLAIAEALGIKEECEGPDTTWEQVRDMIVAAQESATGGDAAPADEPFVPEVNTVYKYQQLDKAGNPLKNAKTKRPLPPIEVVVKKVNADKRIAECVDNQTKKVKIVADFDALIVE